VTSPSLILASASPRRAELLGAAGIGFDVQVADVDESRYPGEAPHLYVARLAEAKARAVAQKAAERAVLGADTVVVADDHVLGKPADRADAERMLESLSGRTHLVLTGVCVVAPGHLDVEVAATTVEFRALAPAEIQWYVASGEPMDKAGAYAIQGLASRFVTRIDGSYSNVVGLPVELVVRMCAEAGILLF
jgi:septum formation protein